LNLRQSLVQKNEKGENFMFKRLWLVSILALVASAVLITGAATAGDNLPGKGVTVQPARATWTTGFFLEAIYSRALEELGYDVKDPKKLANPIFYQSVVAGDVDFWANGWFPLHNAQLPKNFDDNAVLAGTIAKGGALQGYLASKKEVEQFNITSLDDFKRDEVKKAFDANGDGKADLVACPPGWGCEKVITHHMEAYDLEPDINTIKASYSASMADAVARYNAGEPVLFYTWTPNWTVFKFQPGKDVMWINVPEINPTEGQKGFEKEMVQTDVAGAVSDPVKMGFPANDIMVVANKKFLKDNPAAARLFKVMSIPLEDISRQNNRMYAGENTEEDIERHVTEWVALHQDTWNGWLDEARKAAM
jgi:glycine betaine/proline transport system substrate-binding protein